MASKYAKQLRRISCLFGQSAVQNQEARAIFETSRIPPCGENYPNSDRAHYDILKQLFNLFMFAGKKRRKTRNMTRLRFCFADFGASGGGRKTGFGAEKAAKPRVGRLRRKCAAYARSARENIAAPRAYCPSGAKARAACRICEAKRQAAKAHCGKSRKSRSREAASRRPRRDRRSREPYCAMRRNRRAKWA